MKYESITGFLVDLYRKTMIGIDENFLINKGIRKAKEKGLEIHLGEDVLALEGARGKINLLNYAEGVDARKIVALVADDYPQITRRYLENRKRLSMGISSEA